MMRSAGETLGAYEIRSLLQFAVMGWAVPRCSTASNGGAMIANSERRPGSASVATMSADIEDRASSGCHTRMRANAALRTDRVDVRLRKPGVLAEARSRFVVRLRRRACHAEAKLGDVGFAKAGGMAEWSMAVVLKTTV